MNDAQKDDVRDRRKLWPLNDGTAHVFEIEVDYTLRNLLMEWIAEHTTGEFYIGYNVLCFYDPKDAMTYKLYEPKEKYIAFLKLKKDKIGITNHGT